MTVSGLPEPCTHHAKAICHLALDMLEIAGQVKVDEEPVQVRPAQGSAAEPHFCPGWFGGDVLPNRGSGWMDGWMDGHPWVQRSDDVAEPLRRQPEGHLEIFAG